MSEREPAGRTGSGDGLGSDKAAPQSPQNRLTAEFWLPQLGHLSTRATPQSPQKFLSSGLGLPQLGHRTSMVVCVAFNSPSTSSPPRATSTQRTISLARWLRQERPKQMLVSSVASRAAAYATQFMRGQVRIAAERIKRDFMTCLCKRCRPPVGTQANAVGLILVRSRIDWARLCR